MIHIKDIKRLMLITCMLLLTSLYSCKEISVVNTKTYTEEDLYRPNFHFTPKKGWMNDPIGLFYADGQYHLLYQ